MDSLPQLRVLLVGRDLVSKPLEDTLTRCGASNYICVPSVEAADWLIGDGYAADVVAVSRDLLARADDLKALRLRHPNALVIATAGPQAAHDLAAVLASAAPAVTEPMLPPRGWLSRLFGGMGRGLAWS